MLSRWVLVAVVALATGGCLRDSLVPCGEVTCPADKICVPDQRRCVTREQLEQCKDAPDGQACTTDGFPSSACFGGICLPTGCGNSIIEVGEACDDGNTIGNDGCSARCDSTEQCGNGFIDVTKSEACDCGDETVTNRPPGCNGPNSDADGATCLSNCTIRGCGDGAVGGLEDCDGTDLDGATCQQLGFYGGTLACRASCRFDTSACVGSCGDNVKNGSEQCDGPDLGGVTCASSGYYGGTVSCQSNCQLTTAGCSGRCGDGAKDGSETCDGNDFGTSTCVSYGFYKGTLGCALNCNSVNTSGCSERCGDGIKNGAEECDGTAFGLLTCSNYGYYGGTLSCDSSCHVISSACSGTCGDLAKNGFEECDGSDFGTLSCGSFGKYGGSLSCTSGCQADASGCTGYCGDAAKNGPELCDAGDLGGLSCRSYGWYAGTLSCQAGCGAVSTAACSQYCGDGIVEQGELCDGLDQDGRDCADYGGDGGLGCNAFCQTTFERCHWGSWRSVTTPTGSTLNAVWGTSPNDVWAVGQGGLVMHYDGAQWTIQTPPPGGDLFAVWGTSAADVWAVGQGGRILHFNGLNWATQASTTTSTLHGVWGTASNNVYAVGDGGTVVRFTTSWAAVSHGQGTPDLSGIWGTSASNIWMVGRTAGGSSTGAILRYTGTWSSVAPATSGATIALTAVWGSSASNVLFTASNGFNGLILQYNGSSWSTGSGSNAQQPGNAIWGSGSTNVWVATAFGTLARNATGSQTGWNTSVQISSNEIRGVWGSSAGDVWVVGGFGDLYHYDGDGWTHPTSGELTTQGLSAIWGSGSSIWAAGGGSLILGTTGGPQGTWSVVNNSAGQPLDGWAADPTHAWVVGYFGSIDAYTGSWAAQTSNTGIDLHGVFGTSASDVWAVGQGGVIDHYNGSTWTPTTPVASIGVLYDVWAGSPTNAWAVGSGGVILHYDGVWTESPQSRSLTTVDLTDVWGSSASDVWAIGYFGTVLHFNGTTWKVIPVSLGGTPYLDGVGGSGPNDVWIVGNIVTAWHWDGVSWASVSSTGTQYASAVWSTGPGQMVASAANGTVLSWTSTFPTDKGGVCTAPLALYCQASELGSTTSTSPATFTSYTCGARSDTGREAYYKLESPVTGTVSVTLTPSGGDLDLIAIGANADGSCNSAQCKGASQNNGSSAPETITVSTNAGDEIYFVVDGFSGATGSFTLDVSCTKL